MKYLTYYDAWQIAWKIAGEFNIKDVDELAGLIYSMRKR